MSIEYRSGNANEVEASIRSARALEADSKAYTNEIEALRLEALLSVVSKEQESDLKAAIKSAKENAEVARNRATRLGANEIERSKVDEARVSFLASWIGSLEQEHIEHSVAVAQREDSLKATGDEAPTAEEKVGIEARLNESREALKVIEVAWKIATSEYDALAKDSK